MDSAGVARTRVLLLLTDFAHAPACAPIAAMAGHVSLFDTSFRWASRRWTLLWGASMPGYFRREVLCDKVHAW